MNNYHARIGAILATLIIITAIIIPSLSSILNQSSYAFINENSAPRGEKAPVVVTGGGNNIYVVWGTDKNTPNKNGELMFRVSNDGGKTFSNKINLSNSTNADAIDQMISVDGDTIAVTWWEKNQTANVPVMRISTPILASISL